MQVYRKPCCRSINTEPELTLYEVYSAEGPRPALRTSLCVSSCIDLSSGPLCGSPETQPALLCPRRGCFSKTSQDRYGLSSPACHQQSISNVAFSINKAITLNDSSLCYSIPFLYDTFKCRMSIHEGKLEKLICGNQKKRKRKKKAFLQNLILLLKSETAFASHFTSVMQQVCERKKISNTGPSYTVGCGTPTRR